MRRLVRAGVLLAAAAASIPATAIPTSEGIKYTIAGDFSGSLDGISFFDTALTFTGIGNTGTFADFFGAYTLVPVALTVSNPFSARTLGVTENEAFGAYPDLGNVFFSTDDRDGNPTYSFPLIASSAALDSYSGLTFESTTAATYYGSNPVHTTGGTLTLNSGTDVTFTATAIPEPAVWGLMIAGFGLVGVGQRGRRTGMVAA